MKGKKKVGRRPILLDSRIKRKLLTAIEWGNTYKDACAHAGIGMTTFMTWMAKGRDTDEKMYVKFREQVIRATSQGNVRLVQKINKAADKDWRAAAHILACRDPENWSTRSQVVVQHEEGQPNGSERKLFDEIISDPIKREAFIRNTQIILLDGEPSDIRQSSIER
jgi:hypothetical protein